MKNRRIIAFIIAILCLNALLLVGIFRDHKVATSELKDDMHFVSGSNGESSSEIKAAKAETTVQDDFITTAVDRTIKDKKTSQKEDTPDTDDEKPANKVIIEEKKPVVGDPEEVPFDISEPELFESGEVEYADNQILIKFKKSFNGKVSSDLKNAGIGKLEPMFQTESGDWYVAYLHKRSDVNNTMTAVREMKNVVVAEYNFKSEAASIDTDPLSDAVTANERVNEQWVLKSCGIQASWDYLEEQGVNAGGSSSVTVAVIDTGVDYTHRDLDGNIWVNADETPDNGIDDDGNGYVDDYYGIDMTAGMGSGMDDHGHGTHVAGIIAAENNDIGVVGIAYNTRIMPIKAGDASGAFLQSNIANSILYAYDEGADVINMSFGGKANSIAVRDALETAYTRCVLVAAAGNNGYPNEDTDYYSEMAGTVIRNYPGDYKFVLGVMSSDKNDVESGFTNWDANRLNNNEYEVYAPGAEILSTIPGGRYAFLSGTSMASPVVAAQAALLRSVYNDSDMYPTKFIYGQISGTSDGTISCCKPDKHTVGGSMHNLPGRVNFENSLKNMPKPEVSVSDYTIFDTQGFSSDNDGIAAEAATANNGDGIIDSGEVIALGFTLRNRWGMSKDTVVHLDATNELGVTNPYVTFLNNDLSYGSVGTYSEKDAGKIVTDDEWTGWEAPFYLKIADNCPNDYSIVINVTIECKNGLDDTDAEVYQSGSGVRLVARNGVILPNKIDRDMTLTADNYYIIPNATIIMEGATVNVEPGTKIQFWTNDPQDAYAQTAITYLKVVGELICEGTEEAPVELFPSDMMGSYRVEIYAVDKGFVSLNYTNVTNPALTITRASDCLFTQVYADKDLYYRYLEDAEVTWGISPAFTNISDAARCVFYKLGGASKARVFRGLYNTCSFIDSAIAFRSIDPDNNDMPTLVNCVFYGNNTIEDGSVGGRSSSYTAESLDCSYITNNGIVYQPETDKYYVSVTSAGGGLYSYEVFDLFGRHMGGSLFNIDTKDEFNYVTSKLNKVGYQMAGTHKGKRGEILNYDGSSVPSSIDVYKGSEAYGAINERGIHFGEVVDNYLLEIPGKGLATDIALDKYVITLETGATHNIEATLKPNYATQADLIFTSEDESVAVVNENGTVTAVAPGTTQIRVYSKDYAIYNYLTVNVTDDSIDTAVTEEIHDPVVDDEKMSQRESIDDEYLMNAWEEFTGLNVNAKFYSNVILNRINDDNTSGWLRITAPESGDYMTINLGHNYWGTTNENMINRQILDFDDYQSLADIDESGYLTEAPSNTFPFVTEAYLTVNGGKVDTVGNEEVTFVVDFNRAMDTSIDLDVRFGSSYPYAEYSVDGEYVSDTEWQGTVKLTTLIENGYQYFSITNGKAAGTSLKLYKDWGRFPFMIDTASAQSLLMQGNATKNGIELSWTQDDFETLAGYNVYRSETEDGLYTRVNKTVIPADTKNFLDDTVEPGVKYYYNFTVVQSDMTESEPSGKVQVTAKDTMAPNIYHTPVTTAYKGSNLVISATIIDNVGIEAATLYYRVAGTSEWKTKTMDKNNDKYSAVVNSSFLTDAGLEYYIEAFDGNEYTYKGDADDPFFVTVQEAFSTSDLGDVDGNGAVELKDALMLLMAVNDRLNLTEEQFMRADLDGNGELAAKEALKIINYINGNISSLR